VIGAADLGRALAPWLIAARRPGLPRRLGGAGDRPRAAAGARRAAAGGRADLAVVRRPAGAAGPLERALGGPASRRPSTSAWSS
jgi:hypothetical protein